MAVGLQNYQNIDSVGADYPNGRSKDNSGLNDGTPVNRITLGDYQQWFAKLMRRAQLTPSGLADNEYTGNQYYQAMEKNFDRYGVMFSIASGTFNIPLTASGANMFSPLIVIEPAASAGIVLNLPSLFPPKVLSVITIVNDSSNSVNLVSALFALDYVVPVGTTVYPIAAGNAVEVTFAVVGGQNNWTITKKP